MSEHAPRYENRPESGSEYHTIHAERSSVKPESSEEQQKPLAELRHNVTEQAKPIQEVQEGHHEATTTETTFVTRNLKLMARARALKRVRQQLTAPQKVLSRVIHQPAIDNASELASKTIARPSGLLSGGIVAFIGSSVLLYIDKHYGYHYNFLLWTICFVVGFLLGVLLEGFINVLARLRS